MTTLAEYMIIAGADNHPLMLEKSLHDSWKSRMEHYMENRENGRMILSSIQNGPLIWPTITEEEGTTRTKTYVELSFTKKLQADYHCKATNIMLQGYDPIVSLNKAMAFLSAIASTRVTVQQVQGRQGKSYSGTGYKGNATSSGRNNTSRQAKVIKCYNCQAVQSSQQWLLFSSGSGNFLHWQWELLLAVGIL
nr:hypothetical protein [Tanacetum cinerariifolium]